jgi:predicted metal-dependent RNase
MSIEDILNDAKAVVKKIVPDHVEITQIDFEGPVIVIYTKNMEAFAESNDIVRQPSVAGSRCGPTPPY